VDGMGHGGLMDWMFDGYETRCFFSTCEVDGKKWVARELG